MRIFSEYSFDLFDQSLSSRKLKDVLISISEQVVKTSSEQLAKHDQAKIILDNEQNIKDAIRSIGEHHVIEHAVFKLLCKSIVVIVDLVSFFSI